MAAFVSRSSRNGGAAEAEDRDAGHVRAEPHRGRDPRLEARRRHPGGGHRHHRIDVGPGQTRRLERPARRLDEEGFAAFDERRRPLGPAQGLPIPVERPDRLSGLDAGGRKDLREPFEIVIAKREHFPSDGSDIGLIELERRRGRCQ